MGRLLLAWFAISVSCFAQNTEATVPKRDLNEENGVAAKFVRLRQAAKLPLYTRLNGENFAKTACQAAQENKTQEQRFEDSSAVAFIYPASDPESSETLNYIATRPWKHVRHLVVGVCRAQTADFPQGRYWVAIGLVSNKWGQLIAGMTGNPAH